MDDQSGPFDSASAIRSAGRTVRRRAKRILTPVAALLAILYFLIDAVFVVIVRPIAQALTQLGFFNSFVAWLSSLGPYPTLALFLVPLIILEPVKPAGAYLIAKGHVIYGVLLIFVGEVLKVTVVERLFHFSRDKLMSIPAFAWVYKLVIIVLEYLRSQPVWQAASRRYIVIKCTVRRWLARPKA